MMLQRQPSRPWYGLVMGAELAGPSSRLPMHQSPSGLRLTRLTKQSAFRGYVTMGSAQPGRVRARPSEHRFLPA